MYIHVAENLQEELNHLREKALDLDDDKVGFILSRLIRIVGDVIAYSPKENIVDLRKEKNDDKNDEKNRSDIRKI